jgi:hypothetical protein
MLVAVARRLAAGLLAGVGQIYMRTVLSNMPPPGLLAGAMAVRLERRTGMRKMPGSILASA